MPKKAKNASKTTGAVNWKVELLRCSAFFGDPFKPDQNLWKLIVGKDPTNVSYSPTQGSFHQVGNFGNGILNFSGTPGRADWLFHPTQQPSPPEEFLVLGKIGDVLPQFLKACEAWLALRKDIVRLAFGAVFLTPTNQPGEITNIFRKMLTTVGIPQDVEPLDFSFQINRPRNSVILKGKSGILINRLSKWGVTQTQILGIDLSSPRFPTVNFGSAPATLAARLEVDISTPRDNTTPFSEDVLLPVFQELVDLGVEISRTGDKA